MLTHTFCEYISDSYGQSETVPFIRINKIIVSI